MPDLVAYQDTAYAAALRRPGAQVAAAPRRRPRRVGPTLAEAVARGLHKLMAYKDEYEVARLHLLAAERARVTEEVGEDVEGVVQPAPAGAAGAGHEAASCGSGRGSRRRWPALAAASGCGAPPLDPFGRAEVRRIERALVDEYRGAGRRGCDPLTPANHDDVVALAALPDLVRGYEDIKLANVERYRSEVAALRSRLGI